MSFNIKHGLIDEPTDLGLRLDAQVCVCVFFYCEGTPFGQFFGFVGTEHVSYCPNTAKLRKNA